MYVQTYFKYVFNKTLGSILFKTFRTEYLGHGPLAISVEGPHRSDIEYTKDGEKYHMTYKPHEPGMYVIKTLKIL